MKKLCLCLFFIFVLTSCHSAVETPEESGPSDVPTASPSIATAPPLASMSPSSEPNQETDKLLSIEITSPGWLEKYDFEYLNSIGIDVLELIKWDDGSFEGITDITLTFHDSNFSRQDINYWDDLFLEIEVVADWDKLSYTLFCAYENLATVDYSPDYHLLFSRYAQEPYSRCLDLNGDFIEEIIIEDTVHGQRTDTSVSIYRRNGDGFDLIFQEGLYLNRVYYYENEYRFVKGTSDWYDIAFACVIYDDGDESASEAERGETVYKFDGSVYSPVGEPFNYRR